jgi:hypothetical protein
VQVVSAGSVINYGTIDGSAIAGMTLLGGGKVVNGSANDKSAVIEGYYEGVSSLKAATSVTNFGTIKASALFSSGVYEYGAGAMVTNGGGKDKTALIAGAWGVKLNRSGTVVNAATITGASGAGVLAHGGAITNAKTSALIKGGAFGIEALSVAETVKNLGTVEATGDASRWGVYLAAGGKLTNGSATKVTALIEGFGGADLQGGVTATNLGTIKGSGSAGGVGVALGAGGSLINGAASTADGLIEGFTGVTVGAGAAATLTNFGAIDGQGGAAVQFNSSADVLKVEGGSSFTGAVNGDGGTIVLASGTGSATLLAGDSLTVSGSMAATTFGNFATVEVGALAVFTVAAGGTIAAGQALIDAGTLTVAGALTNTGTLEVNSGSFTVDGAVSGTGHAVIGGGTLDFASNFTQNVAFSGTTGVLELAQSQTYTGAVTGFSLTGGTSLDLRDIGFTSSGEATFSGTATSGTLTVTDGTHTAHITLMGDYLSSTFIASSDGQGGVTVIDPTQGGSASTPAPRPTAAGQLFIAAMAGLGGGDGPVTQSAETWRLAGQALAAPRAHLA